MSAAVFLLSAATCFACALLLLRGYRKTRTRLLLWSGLCFLGLALDNIVLFLDLIVYPQVDLSTVSLKRALWARTSSLSSPALPMIAAAIGRASSNAESSAAAKGGQSIGFWTRRAVDRPGRRFAAACMTNGLRARG